MEEVELRILRTTGGHHGLNDTSGNNFTHIGSRRRFLWPGALVLIAVPSPTEG